MIAKMSDTSIGVSVTKTFLVNLSFCSFVITLFCFFSPRSTFTIEKAKIIAKILASIKKIGFVIIFLFITVS